MADAEGNETLELVRAIVEGCGAGLGPVVGVELEVGEVALEEESATLDGAHAILPIRIMRAEECIARIEMASPLEEIACLARRMLGAEDPDAKSEIGQEQVDAIGELLQLMHSAVDEVVRARVDAELSLDKAEWWRTDDPGDNAHEEMEHSFARGSVTVPGGSSLQIMLRVGDDLLGGESGASGPRAPDKVLMLGLNEELRAALTAALEPTGYQVAEPPEEDEDEETAALERAAAALILLCAETEGYLEMCREIRVAQESWQTPILVCAEEPTRELVVSALGAGAWHVLRVPIEPAELLRLVERVRSIDTPGSQAAG